MKYIFILFCISSINLFAQDSITPISNKIEPLVHNYYLYRTKVLHASDMFGVLNDTKDEKIMNLVSQAKTYRNLKPIGFIAIPAILVSMDYAEKSIANVYNSNGSTDVKLQNKYLAISATCLFITVACPTITIVMNWQYKTKMKEAVSLYNQKY